MSECRHSSGWCGSNKCELMLSILERKQKPKDEGGGRVRVNSFRFSRALISFSNHTERTSLFLSPLQDSVLAVFVLGALFHSPKRQTPLHLSRTVSNGTSLKRSLVPTSHLERLALPQRLRLPATRCQGRRTTRQTLFLICLPITEARWEFPEAREPLLYFLVLAVAKTQEVVKK